MRYYPVYLDIRKRKCLVVGGGSVGTRKVMTLLSCGADVTVVSTVISATLQKLADSGSILLKKRPFQASDLEGMFLVFGATDNEALNRQIHAAAERLGLLCNIADRPENCNFILPSIVNRGDLIIAISTSGQSPAFAKKLRKDLETVFGNEYADFLKLMGAVRKKLLSRDHQPEVHKPLFEELIDRNLLALIKDRKHEDINALLLEILGRGYELEALMNE
ncbi:MAG: bifunctional precorrin-2 dehydrogenase/sirohydrochlorin ferrochelatase [Desulfobacterales bacterium]|uniref:precorrin-2 dehydrogenase n=1 Tax=Candidatus Desulfatibia profunda TaxID=2841695 RepID=A0A8J6NSV3_9BACT|nr:bifunctional precorrin-2 dehydrogenase/sirohydrochlorin ferrochelatase [Candidatus Desulfatibia profunda]MBL7180587.1 bifunctional precorrin-2 dehydrogenase/sirohydrochlorin ferrochelatase [Desulfobacterales bacterium]